MSDTEVDNVNSAIEAMLGGNRIKFGEFISAELHKRATDAVNDYREGLRQVIFKGDEAIESEEALEAETTDESEEVEETDDSEETEESQES